MIDTPKTAREELLKLALPSADWLTRDRARVSSGSFFESANLACRAASFDDLWACSIGGEGRGFSPASTKSSSIISAAAEDDDCCRVVHCMNGRLGMMEL